MRRWGRVAFAALMAVAVCLGAAGCEMSAEIGKGKSAYEIAVEYGFSGTEEEWLASLKGERGEQGAQGERGEKGDPGEPGETGLPGIDGKDGASAYDLAVAGGYEGSASEWLASLKGEDGQDGSNGIDGKSAYEIAAANGYEGTEEEWLESLRGLPGEKGEQGIPGVDGADGLSAYDLARQQGYEGTLSEWLASLKGADGQDGSNGVDGKSAYEIAVSHGYEGTEEEWLESLRSVAGKSAYEIAVEHGFAGTEEEWLASLKGERGEQGAQGEKGEKGDPGEPGEKGDKGDPGEDGETPQIGADGYWYIGGQKTEFRAEGSRVTIDEEGYFCIDGVRTEYRTERESDLEFLPYGTGYAVSVGKMRYASEVTIPAEHNGKPVLAIAAEGFRACRNMTLYLPATLETVDTFAFERAENIRLICGEGDGILSAEPGAFSGAAGISVNVPEARLEGDWTGVEIPVTERQITVIFYRNEPDFDGEEMVFAESEVDMEALLPYIGELSETGYPISSWYGYDMPEPRTFRTYGELFALSESETQNPVSLLWQAE